MFRGFLGADPFDVIDASDWFKKNGIPDEYQQVVYENRDLQRKRDERQYNQEVSCARMLARGRLYTWDFPG